MPVTAKFVPDPNSVSHTLGLITYGPTENHGVSVPRAKDGTFLIMHNSEKLDEGAIMTQSAGKIAAKSGNNETPRDMNRVIIASKAGIANFNVLKNSSYVLTAIPESGYKFHSWQGSCTGSSPTCTVTMSSAKSVIAVFVPDNNTSGLLIITSDGSGAGFVSGDRALTYPKSYAEYAAGKYHAVTFLGLKKDVAITLTATPASGSTFVSWSGACSGTSATCAVTMSSAKSVNATFASDSGASDS